MNRDSRLRRPTRRQHRRTSDLVLFAGVAVIVVAVAVGAWVITRHDDGGPTAAEGDLGIAHVHGLGVNPADGALIVATHYGSFRFAVGSNAGERLGGSFQDTMGFTVAGPDRFLGSGHPDLEGLRSGQPSRLGLVESVDAGVSWSPLSLGGEVDFHALAVGSDQVYGWDAETGRLLASVDRLNWNVRSRLDMLGFAVDPMDDDHLVAAVLGGVRESTDGGRAWSQTNGPSVVALTWEATSGLWGADGGGALWRRTGAVWREAGGLPGQPQVLLATPQSLYAAVTEASGATSLVESADGGASWTVRYREQRS